MRRGIATFTLDYGRCPPWLYERMVKLGREMVDLLVMEFGPDEFIKRISDPVWFQALGTVLAFDWNASGLTTILTAVLKEAIRGRERELGIFICGGKGKTSRKTPQQIMEWGSRLSFSENRVKNLVYNSKMVAKVDSALIQDGFELYHHTFFFSKNKSWAVVQQGMNKFKKAARRYHWYSENIHDLVQAPHSGIVADLKQKNVLNLTADQSKPVRDMSVEFIGNSFQALMKDLVLLEKHSTSLHDMARFQNENGDQLTLLQLARYDFHHHPVQLEDFCVSPYLKKILALVCDQKPKSYESFLALPGVGGKTVRALSLVAEVIYGAKPSYTDPARYSFAHGGKDKIPYPVDRPTYDQTISTLQKVVQKTRLSKSDKNLMLKKLSY